VSNIKISFVLFLGASQVDTIMSMFIKFCLVVQSALGIVTFSLLISINNSKTTAHHPNTQLPCPMTVT